MVSPGTVLLYAWVLCVGALAATQAGINVSLGNAMGNAFPAALASISVSSAVLAVACWIQHATATESKARSRPAWWQFTGGLAAAVYVSAGTLLVPFMGYAFFFVCVVLGQIGCSLLLDHIGFLGIPTQRITKLRALAAALCFTGATISVAHNFSASETNAGLGFLHVLFAISAGVAAPLQACVNRKLGSNLARPTEAALINCIVGSTVLALGTFIALVSDPTAASAVKHGFPHTQAWMYLGGVVGVALVFSGLTYAGRTGVGIYFTLVVAGQLTASLIFDATGAFNGAAPLDGIWLRYVGVIIAGAGAAVFGYAKHAATARPARDALLRNQEL